MTSGSRRPRLALKRSGMKVSEIALHVGFPNADYFIHKFKLTTGILPSNYKNHVESKRAKPGGCLHEENVQAGEFRERYSVEN